MITSNQYYTEAFVWIWLPGKTTPVVAGKLALEDNFLVFNYGKSYLERSSAISIYETELPAPIKIKAFSLHLGTF